jgi:hypothetical protein
MFSIGRSYSAIALTFSESVQEVAKHSPLFRGNKYQGYIKKENRLYIEEHCLLGYHGM